MTFENLSHILELLANAFPKSGSINPKGEFIANKRTNACFNLLSCDGYYDVCCKVLEWLSRECCNAQPYSTDGKNDKYHQEMLHSVNRFLYTSFTEDEIALIYQKLGNAINHDLTMEFVISDYDMKLLE